MVLSARHRWPEAAGFTLHRPAGLDNYTFLHFHVETKLLTRDGVQTARPGTCILYPPGAPQWFHSDGPLVHDWMHLSADAEPWLLDLNPPLSRPVCPPDPSFITAGICEIELEINSRRRHRAALADAAAQILMIRFVRAAEEPAGESWGNPGLYAQLYRFRMDMFARMGEPWTVERMAAELHMSASRFHAVYRAYFGASPLNDLIQARIDAAKSALAGSGVSVSALAERLGYANASHFSRQFRQKTGVSPSEYARREIDGADGDSPCVFGKSRIE